MGRGKCISRQLHEQLARTVDVTIQARQAWSGYTIDEIVINPNQKDDATRAVEAYFAAQRGASSGASSNSPSSSLSDAHRRCLEEVRRLAETPPPVPPNGDPSRIRAREQYVDEAKNAASYQDAVFAIFFFNREVNRLPSEPATPNIEPVEVFPSVDEPTYRESYCKARAVLTQTNYVGAAFQRRQGAASPESAMQRMKSEYPGYSDAIYNLVRDKSVEMQALDRP